MSKSKRRNLSDRRATRDYGTFECPSPVRLRTSEPTAESPPTPKRLIPQRKQLAGME